MNHEEIKAVASATAQAVVAALAQPSQGQGPRLKWPDQYPDQLPNEGVPYHPDPFLVGDNTLEIHKINQASERMKNKIDETGKTQMDIIAQKVSELLSLEGGRTKALELLNGRLGDSFRMRVSDAGSTS